MGAWTYYVYFFGQYTVYVVSDRNKYFDYFSQRLSERGMGRIWTTLALTDAGEQFGLSFGVSGYLIFEYRPLEAMFLVGGLGFFICSFYGLCLWCLNLCVGKIISFVTVSASIILVTRIKYLPEWIMYLTPSAWMDLNNLSKYARYEIDVVRAFIILVLGCLCLSGIAYYVTVHSDISG